MRRLATGLMGLTIALAFTGSAFAHGWNHHHRAYYPYSSAYVRVAPAPYVAGYPAPYSGYYPAPYPTYYPAPVYSSPVPYGFGIGVQTRRFGVSVGY